MCHTCDQWRTSTGGLRLHWIATLKLDKLFHSHADNTFDFLMIGDHLQKLPVKFHKGYPEYTKTK